MNVSRPGSRSGSSLSISSSASSRRGRRTELHADRVADLREVVDVRAVEVAGALADPQEVRRRVVRRAGARVDARHRPLVVHQQALVARVELDAAQLVEVGARRLHELDGAVDVVRQALVRLVRRVLGEALVPAVHFAQVGEATLGERADQIDRRRGRVVALQQPGRVGAARALGEVEAVDDVAAVGGQRDVAAGLGVARARLGELPGHPPHLHDRHRGAVCQHHRHLQHRLDAVADLLGRRPGEGLGAVAALQQEGTTGCRARELARAGCRPRPRRPAAAASRSRRIQPRQHPRHTRRAAA